VYIAKTLKYNAVGLEISTSALDAAKKYELPLSFKFDNPK
jgi:hypothetical protein